MPVSNFLSKLLKLSKSSRTIFALVLFGVFSASVAISRECTNSQNALIAILGQKNLDQKKEKGNAQESCQTKLARESMDIASVKGRFEQREDGLYWVQYLPDGSVKQFGPMN